MTISPELIDTGTRSAPVSAGHLIVAQLEREGVQRAYGVPGESFLDVLDGLHDSTINTVITRHEGGAALMALAEGRLTGLPGIALVTRGPGAANAFIAVHTAWQDATPLVLFVGLIPVADRGRAAFQEFDLTGWFGSTAKQVVTLDDPSAAARVVSEAIFIARSGRPGPVVIGLPEDVIRLSAGGATTQQPRSLNVSRPSDIELGQVVARLDAAERPVVVVGGEGWTASAGSALIDWAAAHRIPVLADFRAYDAVPHGGATPAFAGSLGYGRSDAAAALLAQADTAVLIGTARTDVMSDGYQLGLESETVVVLPGEPVGHSGRLDQLITGDHVAFAEALAETSPRVQDGPRFDRAVAAAIRFATPSTAAIEAESPYVDFTAVMAVLREELTADAVITYGAGNHAVWAGRYLSHNAPASLVAPRNGAMGVGIPAAVAASLAFPGREVVSISGDGCFMMNGQEIATAVGYGAPFIAVIADNGVFATIREHQERHYPGRPSGTHLTNPDFAALARSYGGHGETVSQIGAFRDAYRRARASGLPAVLHIMQDPEVRAPSGADDAQEHAYNNPIEGQR
ncbi:thiamine pyrophosphate-dependent enzyme [Cryobacterium sp. PH29-G1]|uniref:thiamine pyrophosphate-dependent enzyme n=1 Tax=Cryobacterium sp. PH29-G1 TaxID=3046211 RepID=UPI0024B97719|nr:thiamine pyrophosphate-dependent enzyme [Cryobacterium sp. PH29-G1]MDJ0348377.1 thiamine pyrophosphate-binding protein [Cryobacterium sp. PH29-G1]